jgi:hypothetical protein
MASLDAIMTVTVLPPEKNPLMGAPNAISGSTPDGANFKRIFLIGNFQIVEAPRRSILVSGTIRGHEYHLVARPPQINTDRYRRVRLSGDNFSTMYLLQTGPMNNSSGVCATFS